MNTHYLLTRYVIEHGHAPDISQLAMLGGCSVEDAAAELRALSDIHGVILEPDSVRIWSLHPFALMPTSFWVFSDDRGWWANCAWCSLGIGAALDKDIAISTFDSGEGEPLKFEVRNGVASRSDLKMHFPYPPSRWWDNPYCPCGNILFFTSDAKIDCWCSRHGRPRGSALPIETAIQLAEWFSDYASPDWKRKSADEAAAMFRELNLDPEFWNLSSGSYR